MACVRRRLAAVLALFLVAACPPQVRSQDALAEVEVAEVRFWSASNRILNHGNYAFWLRLTNRSSSRTHGVLLRASDYTNMTLRKQMVVPPGATLLVPCVLPLVPHHARAEVFVDGQRLPVEFDLAATSRSYGQGSRPILLLSRRLPFDLLAERLNRTPPKLPPQPQAHPEKVPPAAPAAPASPEPEPLLDPAVAGLPAGPVVQEVTLDGLAMMGMPGHETGQVAELVTLARAEVEAPAWPSDWRFYGGFEGVALAVEDLPALPADALGALVRYAECGGTVVVFGPAPAPAGWEQAPQHERGRMTVREVGFGAWVSFTLAAPAQFDEAQAAGLRDLLAGGLIEDWQMAGPLADHPVVGKVTVPVKGTALCILLFALLAGPANLYVLIRRNRRVWLLWTTPLLGVVFSVALVAYFLLGEGVTSRGLCHGVTILNEQTHRATTLGVDGVYCPLPPRGGLRYGADWEVTAAYSGRRQVAREVDLTSLNHYRSGWVQSRVPAAFALRGSRHAAERLPLRLEGGRVVAANGLGTPIRELLVASRDGRLWQTRDLAPGAEAILTPAAELPGRRPLREAWSRLRWLEAPRSDAYVPAPGQYLAVLDRAVFMERGYPAADYRETGLLLGISPTPVDPAPAAPPSSGSPPPATTSQPHAD